MIRGTLATRLRPHQFPISTVRMSAKGPTAVHPVSCGNWLQRVETGPSPTRVGASGLRRFRPFTGTEIEPQGSTISVVWNANNAAPTHHLITRTAQGA